jgi:hypothetical protein
MFGYVLQYNETINRQGSSTTTLITIQKEDGGVVVAKKRLSSKSTAGRSHAQTIIYNPLYNKDPKSRRSAAFGYKPEALH